MWNDSSRARRHMGHVVDAGQGDAERRGGGLAAPGGLDAD
jgi:hypothetical protein